MVVVVVVVVAAAAAAAVVVVVVVAVVVEFWEWYLYAQRWTGCMQVRLTDAIIHLCAGGSIGKNSNTLSTSVYDNERCNDALVKVSVYVLVQVVTQMHYSAWYMQIAQMHSSVCTW